MKIPDLQKNLHFDVGNSNFGEPKGEINVHVEDNVDIVGDDQYNLEILDQSD